MDEYNNNTKLNERMIQYWSIIHNYIEAFYNQYTNSKYNELLSTYKRSIYDHIIDIKNRINHYIDTNHIHRRKLILLQQQIQDHTITKRLWHIRIVLVSTILFFVLYDIIYIPTTTNHTYDRNTSSTSTSNTKQQHLQSRISSNINTNKPVMDIISIGSLLKQQYQNAQQNTFAQNNNNINKHVRKYYRITERNDTDSTCYTTLTSDQLDSIIKFCHTKGKSSSSSSSTDTNNNHNHDIQKLLFHDLYHPKKHTGYICSQKRMIDGLYNIFIQQTKYRTKYMDYHTQINNHHLLSLPDYLLLAEDDTYIQNINLLMNDLKQIYPSNVPYAIAGCVRTSNTESYNEPSDKESSSILQYPHIGYGTILTKAAIERLLEPIYCNFNNNDDTKSQQHQQKTKATTQHTLLACWRLQQNHIGELEYFHDGMNIIELMYIYSKENLYTNIDPWKKKKKNQNNQNFNGYCLLSDTVLAYYINYYHITVTDNTLVHDQYNNQPNDYIRPLYSFVQLPTRTSNVTTTQTSSTTTTINNNQCWLPQYDNTCTKEQHICHKIKPEQMYTLYNQSNTIKGII